MAALVGSNGSCCYAAPLVDLWAQIDRLIHRIIVVRKESVHGNDLNIENSALPEHPLSNLLPGKA